MSVSELPLGLLSDQVMVPGKLPEQEQAFQWVPMFHPWNHIVPRDHWERPLNITRDITNNIAQGTTGRYRESNWDWQNVRRVLLPLY